LNRSIPFEGEKIRLLDQVTQAMSSPNYVEVRAHPKSDQRRQSNLEFTWGGPQFLVDVRPDPCQFNKQLHKVPDTCHNVKEHQSTVKS
jgi:hypothetical protein